MTKRTPVGQRQIPVPEGCLEIYEVYQHAKPHSDGWRGSIVEGYYRCTVEDIKAYVDTLNGDGYPTYKEKYHWRHKAVIEINGKVHLVNINSITVKEIPSVKQNQGS